MERQTILEIPQASLWYYPAEGIVHHEFHSFICGAEFRDVLSQGLELLKQHKATKWLSDDRKNGALPKDDAQWALEIWLPAVLKAGWRTWAMVSPEAIVGKWNIKRHTDTVAARGVVVKIFQTTDEALAWISKV